MAEETDFIPKLDKPLRVKCVVHTGDEQEHLRKYDDLELVLLRMFERIRKLEA